MKYIAIIILSFSLIGCSTAPSTQETLEFENNLKRFSNASVGRANNTLFIGREFPNGRIKRLSYSKAKQLQKILSSAKFVKTNSSTYASDLCYLEIAGRTWYFRPSFKPYGFKLPNEQQKQMENILRKEFGVR